MIVRNKFSYVNYRYISGGGLVFFYIVFVIVDTRDDFNIENKGIVGFGYVFLDSY